jgi:short-subunit dehydrogenase
MNLSQKRILITGAASGIGLQIAIKLSKYPCRITLVDKDFSSIQVDTPKLKGEAFYEYLTQDLSLPDAVSNILNFCSQNGGFPDLIFTNAGFALYGHSASFTWKQIDDMFRVNTLVPLEFLHAMQQQDNVNKRVLVITASAMAFAALPSYAHYAASKAVFRRFEDAYRFEKNSVTLINVYPVAVKTPFFNGRKPPFPAQSPQHVANKIINAVLSDKRNVYPSALFYLLTLPERILRVFIKPYQSFYS